MELIRQYQSGSTEALDTKAGVILGFSGTVLAVLVSAQRVDYTYWSLIGFGLLAFAVVLAVLAMLPRDFYFNPRPEVLLKQYMFKEPDAPLTGAKEQILADKVKGYAENEKVLAKKAKLVKGAAICLGAGVIFVSAHILWRQLMTNDSASKDTNGPAPLAPAQQQPVAQPNPGASNTIKKGMDSRLLSK